MAAGAKLVIIIPRPQDEAAFEQSYKDVLLPMLEEKMKGLSRVVASKVLGAPDGSARTYRLAEMHFGSTESLNDCMQSPGGKEVLDQIQSMSTGGKPILLICEEETYLYW